MLRKLPANTRIEAASKSGDWLINQRKKDTRVILTESPTPGLHVSWGENQKYQYTPHTIEDDLGMSRFFHCTNLKKPGTNLIENILNQNRLRLTEHFFALVPLLQIQGLHLNFPDGAVPYSRTALTQVTQALSVKLEKTTPDEDFVSLKRSFCIKTGISRIDVEKVKDPGLHIYADFDFTEYERLAWVGQGTAKFHSDSSNPIDFVDTPVPCMHNFWQTIFKRIQGFDFQENLIRKEDIEQNPALLQSIFNHKILDLLGALNVGKKLFAATIYMSKGSHRSHLAMRQKMRQIGFKDL